MDNQAQMLKQQRIVIILLLVVLLFGLLISAFLISYYRFNYKSTGYEIERKWLIRAEDIPTEIMKTGGIHITQTYLNFSPEIRVRNINDTEFIMTVKADMSTDGLVRSEKEYYISREEYEHLLLKQEGNTINKTRYQYGVGDNIYEIDIFEGDLEGLTYLEVEFRSEEEAAAFEEPDWVLREVTDDIRYKNGHLARYGMPECGATVTGDGSD